MNILSSFSMIHFESESIASIILAADCASFVLRSIAVQSLRTGIHLNMAIDRME